MVCGRSRHASQFAPESVTGSAKIFRAIRAAGHEPSRIREGLLAFGGECFDAVWHGGKRLKLPDVIIFRPGFVEEPSLHLHAVRCFQSLGIPVINGALKLIEVKNKLLQHVELLHAGIPMPKTALLSDSGMAKRAVEEIGFPVVVKVAFGTRGKGVFFAHDWETLRPIVEYLGVRDGNPVLIQEFIEEARCSDVRAFVVGDWVVAAMERRARANDIRANTSLGGQGVAVTLRDDEVQLAVRASRVFGLDVAGVDLIRSKRGTLVLEVNANPGFKELQQCTGVDIAQHIVDFAITKVGV